MHHLIKDPSIYQVIFLLTWHALEEEREFELHREAIERFLRASWEKVNPSVPFPEERAQGFLEKKKKFILSEEEALDSFSDIRVLSSGGWVRGKGMSSELDARSFDDTLRIHLTYMVEGEKNTDVFGTIAKEVLKTEQLDEGESGKHTYIGKTYYPVAEIVGECDKEEAKKISSEIFDSLLGSPETELEVLEYDWGYLVLTAERTEMPVVLYRGNKENIFLLAQLVHRILPYIFLNRCKHNYVKQLSERSRLRIEKKEREVDALSIRSLGRLSDSSDLERIGSLRRLEKQAIELSAAQGAFIQELPGLKGYVREIEVISQAVDELLDRKVLGDHRTELKERWTKEIDFAKRQLETNLDFYVLSKESADSALDSIYKITQIGSAQWIRIINLLMAIIASWGVVSVFGDSIPSWYWRLPFMFGLSYLLYRFLPKFQEWLKI